ncbi:MAG: polymer-forming cytoskeletal protein [Saprospiraceae bacterium]
MFASASKDKKQTTGNGQILNPSDKDNGQTTVIAKGAQVEGKFSCAENVRLDGSIQGEVKIEKRLVMGEGSQIVGNIYAKDAAIKGRIKGDIIVGESLHLHDTAVIEGNITAKTMIVDEGARYTGSCKIGGVGAQK